MIDHLRHYLSGKGLGPLLVKAMAGSAGLRLVGMFFGFLIGVQLARGLGTSGYGVYGLAMSVIAILTVVAEFGLPQLMTREVARARVENDRGGLRGILNWADSTSGLIAIAVVIALALWLIVSDQQLDSAFSRTFLVGLCLVPVVALTNLRAAALRGLQLIVAGEFPATVLRPACFSLLLLLAAYFVIPLQPAMAMGLGVLAALLALAFSTAILRSKLPADLRQVAAETRPRIWRKSALPMALTEGMRVLHSHLTLLILGLMVSVSVVGVFRVASSVALLVSVPATVLNVVGAPIIARLYAEGDMARLRRLLAWFALCMVCCTFTLTLPFVLAGTSLLSVVFGEAFSASNRSLLIMCGGIVMSSFLGVTAVLLNMTGHPGRVMRASIVSLVLLVMVSPLLIQLMADAGAALAGAVSMVTWNLLMWRDARRILAVDTSILSMFQNPEKGR